jgi:hypothetical protein
VHRAICSKPLFPASVAHLGPQHWTPDPSVIAETSLLGYSSRSAYHMPAATPSVPLEDHGVQNLYCHSNTVLEGFDGDFPMSHASSQPSNGGVLGLSPSHVDKVVSNDC